MKHSICAVLLALVRWLQAGPGASRAHGLGRCGPGACRSGVQGQNIFDVPSPTRAPKPGYAEQTNGERMKVQPGNNAPCGGRWGRA